LGEGEGRFHFGKEMIHTGKCRKGRRRECRKKWVKVRDSRSSHLQVSRLMS
jgi:hypothetical protein